MVLVLLSLIEVSPIKINPWSRLAKIIGHALNAEVLEQQKQTQKKLEEHYDTKIPGKMFLKQAMPIFCVPRSCASMTN